MSDEYFESEYEGEAYPEEYYTTVRRCPSCGYTRFRRTPDGELYCERCGCVISDREIDQGPEWRAFTAEERMKRSRAGAPYEGISLTSDYVTVIPSGTTDSMGKKLPRDRMLKMKMLKYWQIRIGMQSSLERNINQARNELEKLASYLGLPKIIKEEAMNIYRKAVEKGLVRGRSIESVMAAAIYAACRIHRMPRTIDEIAKYTRGGKKDVARCYRLLIKEGVAKVPIANPIDYVTKIASSLSLSGQVIEEAIKILREARRRGLTAGKDPSGLAAAAVYIACQKLGELRTQKEVAQAAQVTEVTVRNRYKELLKKLNIKIPTAR